MDFLQNRVILGSVILLFISFTGQVLCQQQPPVEQIATIFDKVDGGGSKIILKDNNNDLTTVQFDNHPSSVCVVGVWLFYQGFNYNTGQFFKKVEYVFGKEKDNCVNLKVPFAGTISSIRYAGAKDNYTMESFTLYEGPYFQGRQEVAYADGLPYLTLADEHASLIITGESPWTVYYRPGYEGESVCLEIPERGYPAYIADMAPSPNGLRNTIRSIKKGCFGKVWTNYTLKSFVENMNDKKTFAPTRITQ